MTPPGGLANVSRRVFVACRGLAQVAAAGVVMGALFMEPVRLVARRCRPRRRGALVFIPPWVAFRFAHDWRRTLLWSVGVAVLVAVLLPMARLRALARG